MTQSGRRRIVVVAIILGVALVAIAIQLYSGWRSPSGSSRGAGTLEARTAGAELEGRLRPVPTDGSDTKTPSGTEADLPETAVVEVTLRVDADSPPPPDAVHCWAAADGDEVVAQGRLDGDGTWRARLPRPLASLELGAWAPGYRNQSTRVAVGDEASVTATVRLERGWVLRGTVLDPEEQPIPNLPLRAVRKDVFTRTGTRLRLFPAAAYEPGRLLRREGSDMTLGLGRTGPSGEFEIGGLEDADYTLWTPDPAWVLERKPGAFTVRATPSGDPLLKLRALRAHTLHVRLVSTDPEREVGEARVIFQRGRAYLLTEACDGHAAFALSSDDVRDVDLADASVVVHATGFAPAVATLDWPRSARSLHREVRLEPVATGRLLLAVSSRDGHPVTDRLTVIATPMDWEAGNAVVPRARRFPLRLTPTDPARGTYSTSLNAGVWEIHVDRYRALGGPRERQPVRVVVRAGRETYEEFRLGNAGRVVVGAGGKTDSDLFVEVHGGERRQATVLPGSGDRALVVAEGSYRIRVWSQDPETGNLQGELLADEAITVVSGRTTRVSLAN